MADLAKNGHRLTDEELFNHLKSLRVPVRINDLKTPTTELVLRVFNCFLTDFENNGISYLPPFSELLEFECREILDPTMEMCRHASIINSIIGTPDYPITLKDITEPKPKRTKRILYQLVCFWTTFLSNQFLFESIEEKFEASRKEYNEIAAAVEIKKAELSAVQKTASSFPKNEEELASSIREHEVCISKTQETKTETDRYYAELKTVIEEQIAKEHACQVQLSEIKLKQSELEECLISSPDELKSELTKTSSLIQIEDDKLKKKAGELSELKKDNQVQRAIHEALRKSQEDCAVLSDEVSKIASELSASLSRLREDEHELRRLEEQLASHEEAKVFSEQKATKVIHGIKKQIESVSEQLQAKRKVLTSKQKALESLKQSNRVAEDDLTREAVSVHHVIEQCKQAQTAAEMLFKDYKTLMESITQDFVSSLKKQQEEYFD